MDNPTERPPLNVKEIADLLVRITDACEARGWSEDGRNFTVFVLYEMHDVITASRIESVMHRMGPAIRGDRYGAQPLLGPSLFTPENAERRGTESPAEDFSNFAWNVGFADVPVVREHNTGNTHILGIRAILRQPGIVGFAACSEAWGIKSVTPVVKALLDTGTPMHAIKGSQESRVTFAVDLNGTLHRACRWRGDDHMAVDHDVYTCNQVTVSLRVLSRFASGEAMPSTPDEFGEIFHAGCDEAPAGPAT